MRPEHISQGDPCSLCRLPAAAHRTRPKRPEHEYVGHGVLCELCSISRGRHVIREPHDGDHTNRKEAKRNKILVGIDGEGQGRKPHRYVMLAASDELGANQWWVEDMNGLSTVQCLDFLISIPLHCRCFGYGLNYDWTMILKDLPNNLLYYLFRPKMRRRRRRRDRSGPRPIKWNGFLLNMQGTKIVIQKGRRRHVIWDIWKFYQCKFTGALALWKVGEPAAVERMQLMKDKRKDFDKLPHEQVRAYCLEECQYMAGLVRKLIAAHDDADLPLLTFYGAGSTASVMLKKMKIERFPLPENMLEAISAAFSGGRFEHSAIGTIKGPVYSKDISSAYPYQLYFLPCLKHSTWSHTTKRGKVDSADGALVRYRLRKTKKNLAWGPFPFRTKDGSICYPIESGGGWIWKDEYLAGEKLFDNVQFVEAFLRNGDCDCHPFKSIPEYYNERCRIGKSGAGIVFKLGPNSIYGKLAQSVGDGQFTDWILAGMTTSGCRGQVLDMIGLHDNLASVLTIATDGIQSLEDVASPEPRETGTGHTGKPLGGWESDTYEQGIFLARPGIYFPLNPTKDDIDSIKARGIGRAALFENWEKVIKIWETEGVAGRVTLPELTRFGGGKSSISRSSQNIFRRSEAYGEWVPRPTDMSFDPMPKREKVLPGGRLQIRRLPLDLTSVPYNRALRSIESIELEALEILAEEQPDLGFGADYE